MSKNLTRKGLALGAIVALGSSVIAGTPALAANELTVVPSAGTSYNAVAGSVFNLATTFAPGYTPSSYAQLKYIVKSDANSAIKYDVGVAAVAAPATTQAVSLSSGAVDATGASATTINYLGLSADTTSVTSSIEVTAFVDANNDDAVTAGEWNTVRTVTFKKLSEITPVVTLSTPVTGDTTVSATVAWGDLNTQQAGVGVVAPGSTNSVLGVEFKLNSGNYGAAGAYNSTTGAFTKSLTIADNDVVYAQAVRATNTYANATNTYSSAVIGSAVSRNAGARTINSANGLVANVVAGDDANATAATTRVTTTAATVRANGSFTAQVKTFDVSAGASTASTVAAPGVAVVGSVSLGAGITLVPASTGVTEISVTVNGTKYTSNTTLGNATFPVTTDSTGVASLVVSSAGVTAGNTATITVTFAAQNLTAAVVATQTAATYSVTESNVNDVYSTTPGATTALTYAVKDQFGKAISGAYRVKTIVSGGTANTNYTPVVAGSATVNIVDTQLATATSWTDNTVAATLEVQDSATSNWSAQAITAGDSTVIHYTTTANNFTSAPALDKVDGSSYSSSTPTKQTLTTAALADLVAPATAVGDSTWARVALTGANVGGVYSISAPGAFIWANGKANAGAASVQASGSAEYVYIASNTTGTKTITFVTGAVTKTVDVAFAAAVTTTAGTLANKATISLVSAPKTSQSGSSFDVKAFVADKFGNPLSEFALKFAVTGSAAINGGVSTTVSTDADGYAVVKLSSGIYDAGDAVVTVTDNTSGRAADAKLVAATATVAVSDLAKAAADKAAAEAKAAADAAAAKAAEEKAAAEAKAAEEKAAADAAAAKAAEEKAAAEAKAAADAAAAKAAAAINSLSVAVVSTSQVGRAIDVTVTAKNAAGAAAVGQTVTLASTGAGSLSGLSAVTDANGVAVIKLVAGSADLGSAVVTASANGKSASATVEFGATDASVDLIGKRVYVTTEFAAGKRVTIYDNGVRRYSAIQTSDAEKVVMWNVKSGSHTIVVKISGASSDSVTFLVK